MKRTKEKTMRSLLVIILTTAIVGGITTFSYAGIGIDVLRSMDDQLYTASADCTSPGNYTYPARVFAHAFDSYGSGTEAFYYTNHPAIVAPEDAEELGEGFQLLPVETDVSFNFKAFNLPSGTTNLAYWNGTGAVNFSPVSAGNTLSIYKALGPTTLTATVDGAATDVTGFAVAKTCDEGGIHEHPNYSLDGDGFAPAEGIYLWCMEICMPGMQTTEPFFVVMETPNAPLGLYDAVDWINGNIGSLTSVPEPSCWILLGSMTLGLVWLRRKVRARA